MIRSEIYQSHADLFPKFLSRTAFACSVTIINFDLKKILNMDQIITLSDEAAAERNMSSLESNNIKLEDLLAEFDSI